MEFFLFYKNALDLANYAAKLSFPCDSTHTLIETMYFLILPSILGAPVMQQLKIIGLLALLILPFQGYAETEEQFYNRVNKFNPSVDPTLQVSNAWIRPTIEGQENTAAYMTIKTPVSLRILSVYTPSAQKMEFHDSVKNANAFSNSMKRVPYPIELHPGYSLELKPGEKHLMILGLKRPLKEGEKIPVIFHLKSSMYNNTTSAAITVMIPVKKQPEIPQGQNPQNNANGMPQEDHSLHY